MPEELLDVLRTQFMPRPEDATCLIIEDPVACQYDNPQMRQLQAEDTAVRRRALTAMQLPEWTLQWLALPEAAPEPDGEAAPSAGDAHD